MDVLNTKIKSILTEKTNKVRPENIKNGVSILGVTGTYTSDANATANDIVTGKTAYANGQKLTGTYEGIIPTGTISITENGTVDVTNYASAEVNVQAQSEYNAKVITSAIPKPPQAILISNTTLMNRIKECPSVDLTGWIFASGFFNGCYNLEQLPAGINFSSITNIDSIFRSCYTLTSIPSYNFSSVISMQYAFRDCLNLENIPVFDLSKVTGNGMMSTFSGCEKLTDESLNNILYMCAHSGVTVGNNKNLRFIGLLQTQATRCQSLSNWSDFVAAGWSTGY